MTIKNIILILFSIIVTAYFLSSHTTISHLKSKESRYSIQKKSSKNYVVFSYEQDGDGGSYGMNEASHHDIISKNSLGIYAHGTKFNDLELDIRSPFFQELTPELQNMIKNSVKNSNIFLITNAYTLNILLNNAGYKLNTYSSGIVFLVCNIAKGNIPHDLSTINHVPVYASQDYVVFGTKPNSSEAVTLGTSLIAKPNFLINQIFLRTPGTFIQYK